MRSASVFNIRRPFNIESISSNNNNNSCNLNAFSDLQAKFNTESNGISNELDENRTYELLLTSSSSSSNNNSNNNNNNSLDSNNSTSSNNEFSIDSKIKKYNDSINQLTSSSFENINNKPAHDNSKTLLSNPAFNRFFMQQAATSTDNYNKKVCDKSKPTTQMIKINNNNNFECNELSSSIVQGSLIKQQEQEEDEQQESNNNKEENENKKNLESEVSDLKYNLEEQQQQQQLLDEISRVNNNNNNYNLKQRTNYSNKFNPIVCNNEFTRFFANKTQDKFNHNLIINRNSNRTDSNNFQRNYDSRRSSCNNNINNFNYYNSATESLGEESDYPSEFESSSIISNNSNTIIKNNHNNINNYDNKKINGYHHYINNTNKNKTNRIKQLKQFQLNNNKSLQEIYLQQQQLKKSHNQNINSSKNNYTSNNNNSSSNKEVSASKAVAEAVILSSNEIEDKEEYLNDKTSTTNNNNTNTINSKRISYASITLRQPLKDINYFSDTEGLKSTYNNRNRYKRILTVSRNSNNNSISNSIDNIHNNYKQEQLLNNKTLSSLETISKQQQQQQQLNTKTNNSKIEKKSTLNDQAINSFCQFYQPSSIKSQPTKVTMASSSYLNKQPMQQQTPTRVQGYSNLGTHQQQQQPQLAPSYNALSLPSYQKWTPSNQPTIQAMPSYYNPVPTLAPQPPPPPQQQQQQPRYDDYSNHYQSYEDDEFYNDNIHYAERTESPAVDPVQERYERELGSELAKPSATKPNYSDSYFYNSSVFNYPTIDEQKKLAKTIACSLEGGDPATSKFHKKKQNNQKSFFRDGYESEAAIQTPSEYQSARGADYSMYQDESLYDQSYLYDESLPDVIKRSIAKANMTNPIRNVHAPDSFKEQHFTEHVSHTQMPPKVAISLAQELEARQREGGRGAALFQKRKARSEKWIVEDQKKDQFQQFEEPAEPPFIQNRPQPVQPIQAIQQAQQQNQQQQAKQTQAQISHYVLPTVQNTNILNSKFSNNYNAKPKGWGSSSMASSAYEKAESTYGKEEDFQNESYSSKAYNQAYAPAQYEMSQASWTPQKSQLQSQQQSQQSSQMNRFNQQNYSQNEYSQHQQQQQQQLQQSTESKTKFNKLSSHENYLFNNRNAINVINSSNTNNNNNSNYNNTSYNDNESSASSSFHVYTGNPTYYHYDESIAASDL